MANQFGAGLLPYSNGGMVDPFANAMAGGLGQVYGMQQQEQDMRSRSLEEQMNRNKYQNQLQDNPNLAAERALKGGQMGIQQEMMDEGITRDMARTGANTEMSGMEAKNAGNQEAMRMQLANTAIQVTEELAALDKLGGGSLSKQEVWAKSAVPLLQKLGVKNQDAFTYNEENWKKFQAMSHGMQQSVANSQKMGQNEALIAGRADVAEIISARAKSLAAMKAKNPNMSQYMASLFMKDPATWSEQEQQSVDSYRSKEQSSDRRIEEASPAWKMANMNWGAILNQLNDEDLSDEERTRLLKKLELQKDIMKAEKEGTKEGPKKETPVTTPKNLPSFNEYIKKNGAPKTTEDLKKVPISRSDIGKAKMNVGGKMYTLTAEGWKAD